MTRSITNRKRFASACSGQRMRIMSACSTCTIYILGTPPQSTRIRYTPEDVLCDIISWAIRMNDEKVAAKLANPSKKRGPG